MNKFFACLLIGILSSAIIKGQNQNDTRLIKGLDRLLSATFKPAEPGCAVLVAKEGKIIYQKGFGSADLELDVALQPDMVFKLGSITKQFTAVAILQLVEQNKISLQDSLQHYIKDFPSKGHTITIENLLTHTSGLKDYLQINYNAVNIERWDLEPKQIIDSFKNTKLEFEPGTKFKYSNTGYFLLGYIIEKISGKSFHAYIQDNILKPLSLNNTYFDTDNIIIPGRVKGYKKEGPVFKNADFWSMSVAWSAGEMISNTTDLFKWHNGLYSYKILKKETLAKAFTPFILKDGTSAEYGYGWFIKNINGIKSIEHAGAITGFLTNEVYFPAEDIFITALFNSGNAPKNGISQRISEMVLQKSFQTSIKINDSLLNSYTGTYTLVSNPARTIIIKKEDNYLVAEISGQNNFKLLFQTASKFQFENVLDATGEFIKEADKLVKFTIDQNGIFDWLKIK